MVTKSQLKAVKNSAKVPRKKATQKRTARKKKASTRTTIRIDRARFCQELIKQSMNATEAYLAVNPKVKRTTAASEGHKLLREPETINILTPMLQGLFVEAGIEADYIFKRWLEIAEGSAADYFTFEDGVPKLDMSNMTPAQMRNLKSISINNTQYGTNYRIETYDAQKAIDTVGKHLGLLIDKMADEDVDRVGDLLEKGVARIRASKDLEAWRTLFQDGELVHTS